MTTTLEHPVTAEPAARTAAAGVLDITQQGHGTLRPADGHATPRDVQVPAALIRFYTACARATPSRGPATGPVP